MKSDQRMRAPRLKHRRHRRRLSRDLRNLQGPRDWAESVEVEENPRPKERRRGGFANDP